MRGDLSAANSSRLTNGSKTPLVADDPKTQIYNQILHNIKNEVFDTKTEFYKIGKVIGKGAFGKVNLAIHRLTSKFVALKSISK
jgi:serine/threonine protein kinase